MKDIYREIIVSSDELLQNPIKSEPKVDHSDQFDLPFKLSELPRMSSMYKEEGISLGKRSLTEGRGYSYPPVYFSSKERLIEGVKKKITYSDIIMKGGGAHWRNNVALFENIGDKDKPGIIAYNTDNPIPKEFVEEDGRTRLVRYSESRLVHLTSKLGVHASDWGDEDNNMTQYLEKNFGVRSRSLIAMWDLPDEAQMSTEKGVITAKEFREGTEVQPGLEAWAMRSKYRVQDVLRLVHEVEKGEDVSNKFVQGMKLHIARVPKPNRFEANGVLQTSHTEKDWNQNERDILDREFKFLAEEILNRARVDDDPRFSDLAKSHSSKDLNMDKFYKDYLGAFSQVLGEQFAKMENAGAISGMFNHQNISLLGELVDHDVTTIGKKKFDNNGNMVEVPKERLKNYSVTDDEDLDFFNQLLNGYTSVSWMIRDLSRAGIIKISSQEIEDITSSFLSSYIDTRLAFKNKDELRGRFDRFREIMKKNSEKFKPSKSFDPVGEDLERNFVGDLVLVMEQKEVYKSNEVQDF